MTIRSPSFRGKRSPNYHRDEHASYHDARPSAASSPFLRSALDTPNPPQGPTSPPLDPVAEQRARKLRFRVTLLIALLIVAVDLPSVLAGTSMVRILESIYCQQHYEEVDPSKIGADGKIPEQLCKVEEVQKQLSSLRGWMSFWSHLPGLFLAVPFGMLADKYGRKWLFVMNIVAMQGRSTWSYIVCESTPPVLPVNCAYIFTQVHTQKFSL